MLSIDAAHELILVAFPATVPTDHLFENDNPMDQDLNWCKERLLNVPWPDIPLDMVLMNRECPIYFSPEQAAFCLPAYLAAALRTITDKPFGAVYDCVTFFQLTITCTSKLGPLTNNLQRKAISEVVEIVADHMVDNDHVDDGAGWKECASLWRSFSEA